jgi:hypothetical protein
MSDDGITIGHAFAAGAGAVVGVKVLDWVSKNAGLLVEALELQRLRTNDHEKFDALILSGLPRPVTLMTPLPYWLTADERARITKRIAEQRWLTATAEALFADWKRKENPPCPPMAKSLLDDFVANLTKNADVKSSVEMTLASLALLRRIVPDSTRDTVVAFLKARILRKSPIRVVLWFCEEKSAWAHLIELRHAHKWIHEYQEQMRALEEFHDCRPAIGLASFRKRGGFKQRSKSLQNKLGVGSSLLSQNVAPENKPLSSHKKRRPGRTSMNLRTLTSLGFYDENRVAGGNDERARWFATKRLSLKKNVPIDEAVKRNRRAVDRAVRKYRNNGDWDYLKPNKSDATLK